MADAVDLELARACARAVIENEILAIKQCEVLSHLWDLCPGAYALVEDDTNARDWLWDMICVELEAATVTYTLSGDTVADAQRRRLELAAEQAADVFRASRSRYAAAREALAEFGDGSVFTE